MSERETPQRGHNLLTLRNAVLLAIALGVALGATWTAMETRWSEDA